MLSAGGVAVAVGSIESTSLIITWSLADGILVTGYSISYSNIYTQCFIDSDTVSGIAAGETSRELTDLEEGTEYTITVTAILTDGRTNEDTVIDATLAEGEVANSLTYLTCIVLLTFPAKARGSHSCSTPSLTLSSSINCSHICHYI